MTITADGKPVATGKVPGPMRRRPTDALPFGRDAIAPVGRFGPRSRSKASWAG